MKILEDRIARTVLAAGAMLTLVGIFGCLLAQDDLLKRIFDNTHWTVSYTTAAILSWLGYRKSEGETRRQLLLFSLGLTANAVGQVLWVFQVFSGWNPFPGPSDAFFILLGPCLFLAFGHAIRASERAHRRIILLIDGLLISIAFLVVVLALYLPKRGATPPFQFGVLVAYPVAYVAAVAAGILTILYRRPKPHWGWISVIIATFMHMVIWLKWNEFTLDDKLQDGILFNITFSLAALLIGAACFEWKIQSSDSRQYRQICEGLLAFFPLIAVVAGSIGILLSFILTGLPESVRFTIEAGGLVVVLLGAVSQGIFVRDIRIAKDRYEMAIEGSNDGIWDWTPSTGAVIYSDRFARMLGYEPHEFPPHANSFFSRLHPEDYDRTVEAQRAHLEDGTPYDIEYRLITKSGEIRWFRARGRAIRDRKGVGLRMAGSLTDVTSRKRAEALLQEQRSLNEMIQRIQESFIRDSDPKEALAALLPEILKVAESEFGFIGEILQDEENQPFLKAYALTDISWSDATKAFYEANAPTGLEFRALDNLFGYSILHQTTIISNDPMHDTRSGGLPKGHPPLTAFLGIPLMSGTEMVGQLGLANREGGYDHTFVSRIQPLVQTLGSIIAAWRTDRERALNERELKVSNAALLAAERIAKMGHWVRDLEAQKSVWSDSMYELMGLTPGLPPSDELSVARIAPEYRQLFIDRLAEARQHGIPLDHELQLIREDGSYFWVRGIAEPIYQDGKLVGLQGILQDIDSQKRGETELQRVNEMLESAERIARLGHWHNDLIENRIFWSDTMYEICGITKDVQPSLEATLERVAPEYTEVLAEVSRKGREEGIPWDLELQVVRPNGQCVWVRAVAHPIIVEGKAIAVQGIIQDIDEEKQIALALAKSRERYELALQGAELGTWDLDLRSGHVTINERWAEMVGYSIDEVDCNVEVMATLTHPDDTPHVDEAMAAHIEGRATAYEVEHRLRHKDGRWIWVLDKGRITERDADGKPIRMSGTHLDITERKEAERQIREMNTILEQRVQERTAELRAANAELESFAYSVSHDLRSPLRALDGFAAILAEDLGKRATPGDLHYLDRIRGAAVRMSDIIDSLLILSKATRAQLNMGRVDLSETAKSIASDLSATDPNRKVSWDIDENMAADADPNLMRNLLENLIGNAWKYSRYKETAEIHFGQLGVEDGQDVFYVKDNGAGFDMAYADRMFKPFQRLHRVDEFEGTGVGLATVYRILQRHGGTIRAEGAVGNGATIYFTIPRR